MLFDRTGTILSVTQRQSDVIDTFRVGEDDRPGAPATRSTIATAMATASRTVRTTASTTPSRSSSACAATRASTSSRRVTRRLSSLPATQAPRSTASSKQRARGASTLSYDAASDLHIRLEDRQDMGSHLSPARRQDQGRRQPQGELHPPLNRLAAGGAPSSGLPRWTEAPPNRGAATRSELVASSRCSSALPSEQTCVPQRTGRRKPLARQASAYRRIGHPRPRTANLPLASALAGDAAMRISP